MTFIRFKCPYSPFQKKWNTGILKQLVIEYLEQVAKFKRTWNLAPVCQIVQKIPENYCPCLFLSIDRICWPNELWFKRYIPKCTLSHVLIMTSQICLDMARLKIQKLEYLVNGTELFSEIKKILNLSLRWLILRSYLFQYPYSHRFIPLFTNYVILGWYLIKLFSKVKDPHGLPVLRLLEIKS